ncbi:uncharacterized protein LOC143194281 [Rhynchophorus ferrugineus]|uniref:uncharacterized protein LOC143194281 n=1 Tax=Rhynchophorus ferrugineus TaxID=354439 RepID=UPI003FCD8A78
MSLSQKHPGLILTPWFNTAEWLHVYSLAYSDNLEKQQKALEILKIWKTRTPILPAGVEGTLILLELLLTEEGNLTQEQLAQLYAVGLMRFLNLSAANSDKQGSFMKTSAKHEVPKWLINLRHDIAHGHQIPSIYNLKMGLDFGFKWLKKKYWQKQNSTLSDYYAENNSINKDSLESNIKAYGILKLGLLGINDMDTEFLQQFKVKIHKKYKKIISHDTQIIAILEETVDQFLNFNLSKSNLNMLLDTLVSPEILLREYFERNQQDKEIINVEFKNLWTDLLNILHKYKLLPHLIRKLYKVVTLVLVSETNKKMAALWINELLIALNKSGKNMCMDQEENTEEETDHLMLTSYDHSYAEEILDFQNDVLLCPNDSLHYFLNNLLKFNNNSNSFNSDVISLVTTYASSCKNMRNIEDEIFTFQHLVNEGVTFDTDVLKTISATSENNSKDIIKAGSQWRKIEDASFLKNCPIGVLPHQQGKKHPFLLLA